MDKSRRQNKNDDFGMILATMRVAYSVLIGVSRQIILSLYIKLYYLSLFKCRINKPESECGAILTYLS